MEKRGEIRIQLSCLHQPRELPLWRRVFLSTQNSDRLRKDTHTHTLIHSDTHMLVGLGNSLTFIAFYMQMSAVLFSCSPSDWSDIGLKVRKTLLTYSQIISVVLYKDTVDDLVLTRH